MSGRLLVPVWFALVRLRAHAQRALLVAIGIAIGAGVLAMTVVGSVAVQDRSVQRALGALQPSDRAIEAVWSGVPGQSELSLGALDRAARGALRPVHREPAFAVMVFRQATWGGAYVNLGAVDDLSRWLVLRSGHLPRACLPSSCDLVQIGGAPAAPRFPFLHVVGRASLRAGAPLSAFFGAAGPRRPPILLANGVLGFSHTPLPDADVIARTYGWVVPVAPGSIHEWELPGLQARLDRAQAQLERATDLFTLSAPTGTISNVQATGRVSARRLLILGGDAAVLLLGFAVLAATRLRRDHAAVRRRLTWSGGRLLQIELVTATEVVAITIVSSAVGWAAGTGAGMVLARHLGTPAGPVVAHSVLTGQALAAAAVLALLTMLVVRAALRSERVALGGLRLSVADVAGLGALAAILLALARGKADATSLAGSAGTGVFLLLLPGLVLFVLSVVAARVLAPLLRLLERAGRRAPPTVRLTLVSLARSPGQVLLSVVFFVVTVAIAVFAIAYRATLVEGEREQARFAVPAPYVLQEDLQRLVTVQQAATPAQYASLGNASAVIRDTGYVTGHGGVGFTLLALPAAALARIDGWRADFSSRSPSELARLLGPSGAPSLRGTSLPPAATRVELPVTVRGDNLGLTLVVLDRRGDFSSIGLGEVGRGRHLLSAPVPAEARGGRIVALRLTMPVLLAFVAGHKESGTALSVSDSATGALRLGRLRAGPNELQGYDGWVGSAGLESDVDQTGATVRYLLNRAADSLFRPRQPLEGLPVPVLVSPAIAQAAGPGGSVPLHVNDQTVEGQIVGVASHFPSTDGDFVVADREVWSTALNTLGPGTAVPSEIWLEAGAAAAPRLAEAPFSALDASSQRALEGMVRSDPLARGALALLAATALVGLALAAIGVLLTVTGDLRDESGELFDLEAQGVTPGEIRRYLLLRAGVVALLGLAGGLAAGAIVSTLVVGVVTVTAGSANPLPPLELVFDWPLVLGALAVFALGSAVAAFGATRIAFDRVGRVRFSEGLE